MSSLNERSMLTGEILTFRTKLSRDVFKLAEFEAGVVRVDRQVDDFSWLDSKGKVCVSKFEFKLFFENSKFKYWQTNVNKEESRQTENQAALVRQAADLNVPLHFLTIERLTANPNRTQNRLLAHHYLSAVVHVDLSAIETTVKEGVRNDKSIRPCDIARYLGIPIHHAIAACVKLWRAGLVREVDDSKLLGSHWKVGAPNAE